MVSLKALEVLSNFKSSCLFKKQNKTAGARILSIKYFKKKNKTKSFSLRIFTHRLLSATLLHIIPLVIVPVLCGSLGW